MTGCVLRYPSVVLSVLLKYGRIFQCISHHYKIFWCIKPAIKMKFTPARHPHTASIRWIDTPQMDLMSEAITFATAVNARHVFVFVDWLLLLAGTHLPFWNVATMMFKKKNKTKSHSVIDFITRDIYNLVISLSFRGGQEVWSKLQGADSQQVSRHIQSLLTGSFFLCDSTYRHDFFSCLRGCTDILCCILFIIALLGYFAVGIIGKMALDLI